MSQSRFHPTEKPTYSVERVEQLEDMGNKGTAVLVIFECSDPMFDDAFPREGLYVLDTDVLDTTLEQVKRSDPIYVVDLADVEYLEDYERKVVIDYLVQSNGIVKVTVRNAVPTKKFFDSCYAADININGTKLYSDVRYAGCKFEVDSVEFIPQLKLIAEEVFAFPSVNVTVSVTCKDTTPTLESITSSSKEIDKLLREKKSKYSSLAYSVCSVSTLEEYVLVNTQIEEVRQAEKVLRGKIIGFSKTVTSLTSFAVPPELFDLARALEKRLFIKYSGSNEISTWDKVFYVTDRSFNRLIELVNESYAKSVLGEEGKEPNPDWVHFANDLLAEAGEQYPAFKRLGICQSSGNLVLDFVSARIEIAQDGIVSMSGSLESLRPYFQKY